jgi:two-component system, chemotaxis family, CheB/CheR fusion protein
MIQNNGSAHSDPVLGDKPNADDLIVVGIGASAGGVQALKTFFEHVPPNTGIAYVVILHLSPSYDSKLTEILQASTPMKVVQVVEKTIVAPDRVYVVPPNQHLQMVDNHLTVSANMEIEDRRAPVDIFFRTLAASQKSRAVCVVLSGTGANGSMGLKRVKELGGAAFVQNPREAEFNEMPRNSIATELVDDVLPVAEIPKRIVEYKNKLGSVQIAIEIEKRNGDDQNALREIFTQLRIRTGHDFTNYKRPTLLRRIERRINVRNLRDLPSYTTFVQNNAEEATALLKDLLISVTNFFRDKKAFEAMETQVLRPLIKDKRGDDAVRIWVAGCATGEEAYSFAMLCAEQTLNMPDAPKIQIFATDIDEAAIAQAREGLYTITDAADVSPERLRRFFNKEGDLYRVRREVRETILFATHNFLKDPPFSHLDIISCRNVLIYLNTTAQDRVMSTFHFALNHGGYLFVGSSESADSANDLYSIFNRENHIFQKRRIESGRSYPVPDSIPNFQFDQKEKLTQNKKTAAKQERITFGELHQRLLESYAPPSVIVNEEYDIVHLSERAGRYLQVAGGEPSQNLLKLIRQEIRLELRSALYQAVQRNAPVDAKGLKVTIEEQVELLTIHVRPVLQTVDVAKGFILVIFERVAQEAHKDEVVIASDEPVAKQLEEELVRLKAQLRASNEQHEFNAEELKASNEELQAMNEELRSAAEELETSKEELQSINEELRTVNQELKVKVDETTLASNNLYNLINSVDIGTIFLDRSFRVAFFTPAACELFNLIPADYGRPLSDITGRLEYESVLADAETVLEKLQPVEREVTTNNGNAYIMRVLPYRTAEDRINGVVITFVDVTARKQAEQALASSEERLRLLIESAKDYAIFTIDPQRNINSWNTGAQAMMGYSEREIIGKQSSIIFTREDVDKNDHVSEAERAKTSGFAENERWHVRKDGSRFYGSGTMRPLFDPTGKHLGFVKIMRDLTESKQAEQALRESEERLRISLESAEMGVWDWDIASGAIQWNKQHYVMLGLSPATTNQSVDDFFKHVHDDDKTQVNDALTKAAKEGGVFQAEFRIVRADHKKTVRWMTGYGRSISVDSKHEATRMVGVMYDITERKKLEQQKDEFISIASHELKTPVTNIKVYTEILEERFKKANQKEPHELMAKLNSQVDRLGKLIEDLLDTTKIVEGKLPLVVTEFDINQLIQSKVEEARAMTSKHQIIFNEGKLPRIPADKDRIEQVISNLLSNAMKYSPDGGDIIVTTLLQDEHVQISVKDNGVGIKLPNINRVFERFYRAMDSKMETFPGLGLGLYISSGIIKRHNGTIWAESKPGAGSTFTFKLPLENNVKPTLA